MNTNHHDPDRPSDPVLDAHIDALRAEPAPDGPSPQVVAATLAMLGVARPGVATGGRPVRPIHPMRSLGMTIAKHRYLAASVAAAACLVAFTLAVLGPSGGGVAYGQVAEKLAAAKAIAYTMTMTLPDGTITDPTRTVNTDDGRTRIEMPEGRLLVNDGKAVLTVDPVRRTATRTETVLLPNRPAAVGPDTFLTGLKLLAGASAEAVGTRPIGGVEAVGFRGPFAGDGTVTVWADPDTAAPLRIEFATTVGGKPMLTVLDDVRVLDAVDPADFSTEVPDGYAVEAFQPSPDVAALSDDIPDKVAAVLRAYAAVSGGAFPADLNDETALFVLDARGNARVDPALVGTMASRLGSLRTEGYGYAGDSVMPGDADAIVFWFRPAGSETCRVLYGDLTAGDVPADRVPTTQPTTR